LNYDNKGEKKKEINEGKKTKPGGVGKQGGERGGVGAEKGNSMTTMDREKSRRKNGVGGWSTKKWKGGKNNNKRKRKREKESNNQQKDSHQKDRTGESLGDPIGSR